MHALKMNSTAHGAHSLILNQRTSKALHNEPVLFQESRLALSGDQQRIVLIRYIERYSPGSGQWVEYQHSTSIADLTHWIMAHGELHIDCCEDHPSA